MAYSESAPVEGSVSFSGVWVHDPDDPEGTITRYPYGNASGGFTLSVQQESRHYAGRVFPVTDYGEFQDDVLSVGIDIMNDDPYYPNSGDVQSIYDFATLRRTVTVRDGSGRIATGAIETWGESSGGPGVFRVTFTVRQTHTVVVTV